MLDSYYLLNEKIKKHIIMFPIIIIIISTFLLLLLNKIEVPIYLEGTTTLDYDTNFLLKITIPLNKLTLIQNHNQILINEEKYNYQLKEVEEDNLQDKITVHLLVDSKENLKSNTTITYKIEIDKMTFFDYLKQK